MIRFRNTIRVQKFFVFWCKRVNKVEKWLVHLDVSKIKCFKKRLLHLEYTKCLYVTSPFTNLTKTCIFCLNLKVILMGCISQSLLIHCLINVNFTTISTTIFQLVARTIRVYTLHIFHMKLDISSGYEAGSKNYTTTDNFSFGQYYPIPFKPETWLLWAIFGVMLRVISVR